MTILPLLVRTIETPILSVSELTAHVRQTLEEEFDAVAVRGEVSNLARPRSGHVYFSLKDEQATLRCVMWKYIAQNLVFDLADGQAVRAWGRITVYAVRGEYQLDVRKVEPEGTGALELAFRQRVARLAAEGLFDAARKRPLPVFPRRIVVVASPTGAAVHDVLQVIKRRWPVVEVLIAAAKVQGLGAAEEVAEAIALAGRVADAELILVARGGGSLEDLWTFNEEIVARAIFASRLPVVTGIGHEVDTTIADLVADCRALTPSEAAERSVPDARQVRERLDHLAKRIARAGQMEITRGRDRLDRLRDRMARAMADEIVEGRRALNDLGDRADRSIQRGLDQRGDRLARLAAQLEALSPLKVLARGYSLTWRANNGSTVLRSAQEVRPGELIRTRLASGTFLSRVEEIEA